MHTFYNNIPRERNWKTSPYRKQFLSSKKPLKYWNYKSISIQHETLNLHLESNSLPSLCNFLLSNFIFVIFVLCKLSKEEVPCYIFFSARIHATSENNSRIRCGLSIKIYFCLPVRRNRRWFISDGRFVIPRVRVEISQTGKFKGNSGADVINIFARSFHLISQALITYVEIQKFSDEKARRNPFAFHVWTRIYIYIFIITLSHGWYSVTFNLL